MACANGLEQCPNSNHLRCAHKYETGRGRCPSLILFGKTGGSLADLRVCSSCWERLCGVREAGSALLLQGRSADAHQATGPRKPAQTVICMPCYPTIRPAYLILPRWCWNRLPQFTARSYTTADTSVVGTVAELSTEHRVPSNLTNKINKSIGARSLFVQRLLKLYPGRELLSRTMLIHKSARKPYDYLKPRPCYPRSKTGCLSCRVRKKKCDGEKPQCRACRRNKFECTWPSCTVGHRDISTLPGSSRPLPESTKSSRMSQAINTMTINPVTNRALSSTPAALQFLAHYTQQTAGLLAPVQLRRNPFLSVVLPHAHADTLLMHCVLALGGAHLAVKCGISAESRNAAASNAVTNMAAMHYLRAIGAIRAELDNPLGLDGEKLLKLLLAIAVLSHYEVRVTLHH